MKTVAILFGAISIFLVATNQGWHFLADSQVLLPVYKGRTLAPWQLSQSFGVGL
jgi:hypothetical protein